jgi:hypothetical protein
MWGQAANVRLGCVWHCRTGPRPRTTTRAPLRCVAAADDVVRSPSLGLSSALVSQ